MRQHIRFLSLLRSPIHEKGNNDITDCPARVNFETSRPHSHGDEKLINSLRKENKILLKRCHTFAYENTKLKDLSSYWNQRAKKAENIVSQNFLEKMKMTEDYKKISKERDITEKEIIKCHKMLDESNK